MALLQVRQTPKPLPPHAAPLRTPEQPAYYGFTRMMSTFRTSETAIDPSSTKGSLFLAITLLLPGLTQVPV